MPFVNDTSRYEACQFPFTDCKDNAKFRLGEMKTRLFLPSSIWKAVNCNVKDRLLFREMLPFILHKAVF